MPRKNTAREALDNQFLEIRSRVLDIAAALDRIDQGADASKLQGDQRLDQIRKGIETLLGDESDRARRVQMIFSDPYQENWRGK